MSAAAHPSRMALDRIALGEADPAVSAHARSCAQCTAHLEALKVLEGGPDFVHPSALALDRWALGQADDATEIHAKACARCAARVAAVQVELPLPDWVKHFEAGRGRGPKAWWRPFAALGLAATAAVAVLVLNRPAPAPYVGDKGAGPSAQVWVNRAGQVSPWNGAPLHPDDAFRFQVQAGGRSHLTVVELQSGTLYRVLFAAPVPSDGLSPAWSVDAQGTVEEVAVLLSGAPLSEEELKRALAGEGSTWLRLWKFPKEVP